MRLDCRLKRGGSGLQGRFGVAVQCFGFTQRAAPCRQIKIGGNFIFNRAARFGQLGLLGLQFFTPRLIGFHTGLQSLFLRAIFSQSAVRGIQRCLGGLQFFSMGRDLRRRRIFGFAFIGGNAGEQFSLFGLQAFLLLTGIGQSFAPARHILLNICQLLGQPCRHFLRPTRFGFQPVLLQLNAAQCGGFVGCSHTQVRQLGL